MTKQRIAFWMAQTSLTRSALLCRGRAAWPMHRDQALSGLRVGDHFVDDLGRHSDLPDRRIRAWGDFLIDLGEAAGRDALPLL